MQYRLYMYEKELKGCVILPSSKSVSNRMLILDSLAEKRGILTNLSESDDTRVLEEALKSKEGIIDIGHAGTAMRFLTAYLSIRPGKYILTGSERMKQRPIAKLVGALNELGAGIEYLENPGYPPLSIRGKHIDGGEIRVDSSISSQYISALMMIGPALKNGLAIHLENEVVSSSYIHLTKNLMLDLGIPVSIGGTKIEIPFQSFKGIDMYIEGDWSAASYWYALAALSERAELEVKGLQRDSYQGDSVLPELFLALGVETIYRHDGVLLRKTPGSTDKFEFDFSDNPDLVQTFVVVCALRDIPFYLTGTRTLKIKETDRIFALQTEMKKMGFLLESDPGGEWLSWDGGKTTDSLEAIQIETYQDHRMAMAF
ncbi:MAG: 3-phosphoshikimate 1-carboxyvinyltransferase, partial [Bacteroidales bacterium]|nr:3-phosphoshikimate 1-carboxyvinyltransferase [Bacteroidales bacterium]